MKRLTTLIELPKIAMSPSTRKANKVEVSMQLNYLNTGEVQFRVVGYVWNCRHTHMIRIGQCLEELRNYYVGNKLFGAIYSLWKRWHMNNLREGTATQIEALINWEEVNNGQMCYDTACQYLKKIGLYEVPHPKRPGSTFHYGEEYICEELPKEVIAKIKRVMRRVGYAKWENGKGQIFEPDPSVSLN